MNHREASPGPYKLYFRAGLMEYPAKYAAIHEDCTCALDRMKWISAFSSYTWEFIVCELLPNGCVLWIMCGDGEVIYGTEERGLAPHDTCL